MMAPMLPFTPEQFLSVFAAYHTAVWPAPLVAYGAGAIVVAILAFGPRPGTDRTVAAILAALWAWTGAVYHGRYFAAINPAALGFAVLFVSEAALFLPIAFGRGGPRFAYRRDRATVFGVALVAYAAVIYPVLGHAAGHVYPATPVFGITPCPLTLFTLGLMMLAGERPPALLLAIPTLWSLIGGSAAALLDVPQDWPLLFAGVATVAVVRTCRPVVPPA